MCQFTLALCRDPQKVHINGAYLLSSVALTGEHVRNPRHSAALVPVITTGSQAMPTKPRRRRQAPDQTDLETNVAPAALRDDLRRRDQKPTPPDSMPPRENERQGEVPAGGGFTPTPDGGNAQHPIHDEDQEDATSDDYEREIDRLDAATRAR